MSNTIKIWDDDGPEGKTTCMEISGCGNGDWYISIAGVDWAGNRTRSDGFRACTSGARHPVVTTCVALLAAIGRGDRELATTLAKNIVDDLERGDSRLPNEDDSVRVEVSRRARTQRDRVAERKMIVALLKKAVAEPRGFSRQAVQGWLDELAREDDQ